MVLRLLPYKQAEVASRTQAGAFILPTLVDSLLYCKLGLSLENSVVDETNTFWENTWVICKYIKDF